MGIDTRMNAQEVLQTQMEVDRFNKSNAIEGRQQSNEMGKDEFLKLLLTQLSHQDPTSPMDNNEFIAQMAQFSSLEQMHNMSEGFNRMAALMNNNDAVSTLGKTVDIEIGSDKITGVVESVTRGQTPQVLVNGNYYNLEHINAVYGN
ncbi:MAG: flagellar hook assembly protein FlgD [Treponema sp.]|nr:flagellar hook assembly protein FlgD [Candidatus Treponema merdequi]